MNVRRFATFASEPKTPSEDSRVTPVRTPLFQHRERRHRSPRIRYPLVNGMLDATRTITDETLLVDGSTGIVEP